MLPTLAAGAIDPTHITIFLLSVGVLLGLAKLLGEVARWLRQPAVLGEIAAGIILGPTLIGGFFPGFYGWMFPEFSDASGAHPHVVFIGLQMLVTLSVVLLLLTAGLEVDLSSVFRQGKATLWVSLFGMAIPFATGFALGWFVPKFLGHPPEAPLLPFALFMGIALAISALPVIAKIMMDINMAKSDMGAMILSAAMIDDFLGWIGFALVLAMMQAGPAPGNAPERAPEHESGAAQVVENVAEPVGDLVASHQAVESVTETAGATVGMTVLLVLLFAGLMLTVGRLAAHRVLPWVQANLSWPGGVLVFVIASALLCAAFTEWIGIHAIFGAFILGVVMGDSHHLTNRTREMIHQFVTNIFAPLFFATVALRLNFVEAFRWDLVLVVLVVAIIGKLIGCYIGGLVGGLGMRDRMVLGSAMVARGAMEVILGQLAYSFGLISEELLVAIIVMALATSIIAGPAMQWLLKQKKVRNLADVLTPNAFIPELRATNKQDAIAELSEAAAKISTMEAREIYEGAWRRERRYSTGLDHGIAVPHARCKDLKDSAVVVGLSEAGIDFQAMDGQPSRIICLLLTPDPADGAQIELLDMVARAFSTPAARKAAVAADNLTEFRAALAVHADGELEADVTPAGILVSKPEVVDDKMPSVAATPGPKGTLPG